MKEFCDILEIGHPVEFPNNKKFIDLTNKKSNRLIVIEYRGTLLKNSVWLCQCQCENKNLTIVRAYHLKNNLIQSCGCLVKEINKKRCITHGESDTELYACWLRLRRRCDTPKSDSFYTHGGRGIKVCERWSKFENFKEDMLSKPKSDGIKLSIDRIDNDGDYTPENCRWATDIEQANNKRNNVNIEYRGEVHTVAEWSRIVMIPQSTIHNRLKSNWPIEKILTTPSLKRGKNKDCNH